jgi:hypothetical protein
MGSYLTVTTPKGGKPTVIIVLRLSRFRSGIGQTSPYDGNVYGFLGEVEEGQMPPLMVTPKADIPTPKLARIRCVPRAPWPYGYLDMARRQ